MTAPTTRWVLTDARGINAADQIVGTGTINGVTHAFVATPVQVPEPGMLTVLGVMPLIGRRQSSCRLGRR